MPTFTVHQQPIERSYRAYLCSYALVFQVLITALIIIPPIFVAYKSQGFWLKEDTYREQPEVQFKHDFLVLLQGRSNQRVNVIGYSTYQQFNTLLGNHLRIPVVEASETDTNEDGRSDWLDFQLEFPIGISEEVNSMQLVLLFDYKLHKFCSLQMESLAFISYTSALAGAELTTSGDLLLRQRHPLPNKGRFTLDTSIFDSTSLNVEAYDFARVLQAYDGRNVSTYFDGRYPMWRAGSTASFTVRVRVRYGEQVFTYRPGFWRLAKHAWIQYVAILLIFSFVLGQARRFVFREQVVTTIPLPHTRRE